MSVESRDSYSTNNPSGVNRLYYDDEDVEQPPHGPRQQYDRRQQHPYPNEPPQGYNQNDSSYDPYGITYSLDWTSVFSLLTVRVDPFH
jgi:hypothetical protein